MNKEFLTVKELTAELRMSPKSIQRVYHNDEVPVPWLDRTAWLHLAKVHGYKTTLSVPNGKKGYCIIFRGRPGQALATITLCSRENP